MNPPCVSVRPTISESLSQGLKPFPQKCHRGEGRGLCCGVSAGGGTLESRRLADTAGLPACPRTLALHLVTPDSTCVLAPAAPAPSPSPPCSLLSRSHKWGALRAALLTVVTWGASLTLELLLGLPRVPDNPPPNQAPPSRLFAVVQTFVTT